ncbi:MAG: hypothetical protein ACOYON_08540 [Fimbriimonas sp.]
MKLKSLYWILLLLVALVASSCGGSSSTGAGSPGRLAVSIAWPDASRLIPNATSRIKVTISKGATTFTQTLARPTGDSAGNPVVTTASFDDLEEGEWTAVANAYPDAAATGAVQATGSSKFIITGGQATTFNVTMNSTVKRFEVVIGGATYRIRFKDDGTSELLDSAGNAVVANPAVKFDSDFSLTAKPAQEDNTLVLVDNGPGTPPEILVAADSKLTILSSATSNTATVTTTGVSLRPVTPGDSTVTFTARESGRIFTLPITVKPLYKAAVNVDSGADVVEDVSAGLNAQSVGAVFRLAAGSRYSSLVGVAFALPVPFDASFPAPPVVKRAAHPFSTGVGQDLLYRFTTTTFLNLPPVLPAPARYGKVLDLAVNDTDSNLWLLHETAANTFAVTSVSLTTGAVDATKSYAFTSTDAPVSLGVGPDASDPTKPVFYLTSTSGRVQRYKPNLTALVADPSGIELSTVNAIDVDTDGRLVYVLDGTGSKVLVLRYDGTPLTTLTLTPPSGSVRRLAVRGSATARKVLVSYSGGANNGVILFDETP